MKTYILKLGGSVITRKDENHFEIREHAISRIAREILSARKKVEFRLVVIHGAGPFGHSMAARYGIGVDPGRQAHVEGFVKTHLSVAALNRTVVRLFNAEGLLSFPVQPSSCVVQAEGRIVRFETEPLRRIFGLHEEMAPVLYGDVVTDEVRRFSILSGDALAAYLTVELGASAAFLGTDVDGVMTADPKLDPGAGLIEKIDRNNVEQIIGQTSGASTIDLTGGMQGKLRQMAGRLSGVRVFLFNMVKPDNTFRALAGLDCVGTEMLL